MSVPDHGLDAIRKSANQVIDGDPTEYYILTKILDAVAGSFTPDGLQNDMVITTFQADDTAQKIPPTPLTDRKSLSIENVDDNNSVWISKRSDLTADFAIGTQAGRRLLPGDSWDVDIKPGIEIYCRCESATTAIIQATEIS